MSSPSEPREPLSATRVVEAALRLVDRDGLEQLSMRKLGRELGVEAMALYHYFPSKEALLDALVERVVAEMEPPPGDGTWDERLRATLRSYRRLSHAHPNVFPLLGRRSVRGAEGLQPVEWALDLLRGAGLDPRETLAAFRTLSSYAFGYALSEAWGFALEPTADGPSRFDIRTVDPARFPRMREVAPHLVACDHDAEFERGLDLIISGLRAQLATS
ncbi:MAG: TetR/AcrR family transcriptional regulator C-terminal domain-containing protein [Chloroflexota bacterium]|nr:TetR/AcrR family transcriptional regulator C-terminal domain-containing protein [Chloroflexota bacterium]